MKRNNYLKIVVFFFLVGAFFLLCACDAQNSADFSSVADPPESLPNTTLANDAPTTSSVVESTTPTIFVENTSANKGDTTVELAVNVKNNPGILGMLFSVHYDESVMTLVDCQNGAAVSALTLTKPSNYGSGCNFVWYGNEAGDISDGTVLTLVFDITESASSGNYPIEISYVDGDICDASYNPIAFTVEPGLIIVS